MKTHKEIKQTNVCINCGKIVETTSISSKYECASCKRKKGLISKSPLNCVFIKNSRKLQEVKQ